MSMRRARTHYWRTKNADGNVVCDIITGTYPYMTIMWEDEVIGFRAIVKHKVEGEGSSVERLPLTRKEAATQLLAFRRMGASNVPKKVREYRAHN